MDLSKEYLQLIEIIKHERVNYSKSVTQLVKSRPWYFYLTKNGVIDFLQNGAPNKTDELFAAKAYSDFLSKFNEVEIQSLKKFSELNVSLQKDASIDATSYRAFGLFTVTFTILLFLLSIGKYQMVIAAVSSSVNYLKESFPIAFNFAQIALLPIVLGFMLTLISLFARIHYLTKAIEIDRNLEKAILIMNVDPNRDKIPLTDAENP